MSWISFISGGMAVILVYAFYSVGSEDSEELVAEDVAGSDLVINDFSGTHPAGPRDAFLIYGRSDGSTSRIGVRNASGMSI
ncbi:hypothetical protein [Neobacillus drentensis]|uniref:hypothetical protein n=1 Tax=Neobacillus drentensis TaxID=220684 RepID=UPI0030035210